LVREKKEENANSPGSEKKMLNHVNTAVNEVNPANKTLETRRKNQIKFQKIQTK
jgi:hypothetical protein